MVETDFVVKAFGKAFGDFSNKRIVLYGLSKNSEVLIKSFPQYNFIGLLDGYQENGEMYERPILSLSKVEILKPDCIIIIARTNSRNIIVKKIKNFCLNHKINVYDIHGEDLLISKDRIEINHPYFSLSEADIQDEIQKHEVISFDIFDTLLMRKVLFPEDIFTLVEEKTGINGFKDNRVQAERQLNRTGATNIKSIYRLIKEKMNLDNSSCEYLMKIEFATEQENLIIRKSMVELLQYANALGKKIYLISDMYWSAEQIKVILKTKGIFEYEYIFVSSDYGTFKTENLYEVFKTEIKANSYLHIGDDEKADIVHSKLHGIDSIHIYSALNLVEISSYAFILDQSFTFRERMLLGLIVARIFNSPFALYKSKGKVIIDGGYNLGYCLIAPIFTAFLFWLLESEKNRKSHILFAARDGYILDKMYSILKARKSKNFWTRHTYFYISRMAAVAASLKTKKDIQYASKISFDGDVESLLSKRFFLKKNEILSPKKNESFEAYIVRHEKFILQKSKKLRDCYRKYIDYVQINKDDKVVFFDFVSSGTCQMCLEEILEKKIKGKYCIHFLEEYGKKEKLDIDSFFETGFLYDLKTYLSTSYLLVESVIASLEPTLKGFSEVGLPIFAEEKRTDSELQYVKLVQQGILDCFTEYIDVVNFAETSELKSSFVDTIYSLLQKKYTSVKNCVLERELSRDEFCNRKYVMSDILD